MKRTRTGKPSRPRAEPAAPARPRRSRNPGGAPAPPSSARKRRGVAPRTPAASPSGEAAPIGTPSTGVDPARFPVVALGASAGGLIALEHFFQHLPADT